MRSKVRDFSRSLVWPKSLLRNDASALILWSYYFLGLPGAHQRCDRPVVLVSGGIHDRILNWACFECSWSTPQVLLKLFRNTFLCLCYTFSNLLLKNSKNPPGVKSNPLWCSCYPHKIFNRLVFRCFAARLFQVAVHNMRSAAFSVKRVHE